MDNRYAIIEIGSNNTKVHIYENNEVLMEETVTIEFKKYYTKEAGLRLEDVDKLFDTINDVTKYTKNIHLYGCSIFRKMDEEELKEFNAKLEEKFAITMEVVSQEEEAELTALGCYDGIDYHKNICIFIGGGGSTEVIFVKNAAIIGRYFFDFGVVDITNKYPDLKDDVPTVSFNEVTEYVKSLIGKIKENADIFILGGGDHLYWYNNCEFKLNENTIYKKENEEYMIDIETSDKYDHEAFNISLDAVRQRSDNPLWFDGSRAMKTITNVISHSINAKYIIPTKINMEDGIKAKLNGE